MCYFLVEGYGYTRSKRKYGQRLLLFACVSQPFYVLAFHTASLNMLFSLFFCFLLLVVWERTAKGGRRSALTVLLILATGVCDWPFYSAVFTVLFIFCRGSRRGTMRMYGIAALMFMLDCYLGYSPELSCLPRAAYALASSAGILLSGVVIVFFYTGRKGRHGGKLGKWFFYAFYPAHLAILCLIRYCLGG